MQEPYRGETKSKSYGTRGFHGVELIDVMSLPALIYLIFSFLILTLYSSLTPDSAFYESYKLTIFLRSFSYFSIFFVPTILIYFAFQLNKKILHTVILTVYPIIVVGGLLTVSDIRSPEVFMLSGFVLFAFYFVWGLTLKASSRPLDDEHDLVAVRPRAEVRQGTTEVGVNSNDSRFTPPQGFFEKLDKFLDRYDYVDGEAVRKNRAMRNTRPPTRSTTRPNKRRR